MRCMAGRTKDRLPPAAAGKANCGRKHRWSKAGSVALAWVTCAGRRNRLVHDAADGARAAAALDAAAEATIDLAGGARRLFGTDRGAHVVVSQHVARTDNHGSSAIAGGLVRYFKTASLTDQEELSTMKTAWACDLTK